MSDLPLHGAPGDGHLEDERLSAAVDGEALGSGAAAHVRGCPRCSARQEALVRAVQAVRAPVPPLAASVLDAMVASAVAAATSPVAPVAAPSAAPAPAPAGSATTGAGAGRAGGADGADGAGEADGAGDAARAPVVPLSTGRPGHNGRPGARRGFRALVPPLASLVVAAAAFAGLAGLANLAIDDSADETAARDSTSRMADADKGAGGAGADVAAPTEVVDPEVVSRDLGAVDDPQTLAGLLDASLADRRAEGYDGAGEATPRVAAPAQDTATTSAAEATAGPATPTLAAPARARCAQEARAVGGSTLGAHVSTARVVWQGQPAEVLVFALADPAEGVTRRAFVLSDPGCALLADPRF